MAAPALPPPARFEVQLRIISSRGFQNVNWRHGHDNPYAVAWVEPSARLSTYVYQGADNDNRHWMQQKLCIPFSTNTNESTLYIEIHHADPAEDTESLIGRTDLSFRDLEIAQRIITQLQLRRSCGQPQGHINVEVGVCAVGTAERGFQMDEMYVAEGFGLDEHM